MFSKGQIPLDGHGPNQTRHLRSPTKSPSCLVLAKFHYTSFVGDPIGICRRPGRRPGSPTKSGRARLVEFGHKTLRKYM